MDANNSPSLSSTSPAPSIPKRGVSRPDDDTPAAISAWEAEIVEKTRREHRERLGSSGGHSNSDNNSNMYISWADRKSNQNPTFSSPRTPTSPASVSRRGYIQDPIPSPSSNASNINSNSNSNSSNNPFSSLIRTTSPRPNTAGSVSRSRRSESINSIGQASNSSSGFIDYSSKRRSSITSNDSSSIGVGSGNSSVFGSGGNITGMVSGSSPRGSSTEEQSRPAATTVSPSSQRPSFLEEYGLELEDSNNRTSTSPTASSARNTSRFRGLIGKDRNGSGTFPPPIPIRISSPLSLNNLSTSNSNFFNTNLSTLPASPFTSSYSPAQTNGGSTPIESNFPSSSSSNPDLALQPPAIPPRPRLDSDASFYPPDDISIFRGINSSTSTNGQSLENDSNSISNYAPSYSNSYQFGEDSVSSHTSSESKVRGINSNPNNHSTNEVDFVRSALAKKDETGSGNHINQEYDYSNLVATSESDHTREDVQSSSSSNLPPKLPSRNSGINSSSTSIGIDRGISSGIESIQGPPALPRRPKQSQSDSNQPAVVETKAEKKEREALEKLEEKNEKNRIKEEAHLEKQQLKDEANRIKDEVAAKKIKDQEEAKREKERVKWRKEKKKNEEIERSILEASVEELEIAQFLNSFGKHVHEVKAIAPLEPDEAVEVEWPRRSDWVNNGGGVFANIGYSVAVLTAIACYLSPRGPTQITIPEAKTANRIGVEIQGSKKGKNQDSKSSSENVVVEEDLHKSEFSLDALKSNGERLYLTALPMYENFFSSLISLGRWDKPLITGFTFLIYSVFWWNGLLLPGFFSLIIFFTLKLKAVPIKPDALRKIISIQNKRRNELENFENGLKEDDGKSILKEAELENLGKENDQSKSSDSGIPNEVQSSSNSIKSEKYDSESIKKERKNSKDKNSTDNGKDPKGKYSLAAEATRKYGTIATFHTSNLADVHERIKNFFYWKSPSATTRSLCWLVILTFSTLFLSPTILIKIPGAAIGISFFFVLPIAQRKPEWLPAMANPIELLLAGVPNDAQVAIGLMRKRALYGKDLIGDQRLLISPDFLRNHEMFEKNGLLGLNEDVITDDQIDILLDSGKKSLNSDNGNDKNVGGVQIGGSKWNQWKNKIEKGRDLAIKGSEIMSGQRGISLPRISSQDQGSNVNGAYSFLSKSINSGLDYSENYHRKRIGLPPVVSSSNSNQVLKENDLINQPDGYFFSMFKGYSGHLIVGNHQITFKSIFAKKVDDDEEGDDNDDENENENENGELENNDGNGKDSKEIKKKKKIRIIFQINLDQILTLRKTKSLNLVVWSTDGLNVKLKNGETLVLSNMLKRDEAFNRILALSPSHWQKV